MAKISLGLVLAACAICAAVPVSKEIPILKPSSKEVFFRISEDQEPFSVPCAVSGTGQGVKYTWQKDSKPLSVDGVNVVQRHGEGTLVFLKPSPNNAGDYTCLATSDLGTASSGVIRVRQAYIKAPKPTVKTVKAVEDKGFKMECNIPDSYPKPEITWRYESVIDPEISNEVMDPRITFSPEGSLFFTGVVKKDARTNFKYVCYAKTPASDKLVPLAEYILEEVLANDHKDNEVTELYASKDMTVKVGDRTYIYCIFGGVPQAHPDWFHDGSDVNGSPEMRVTRYNRSKGKRLLIRDTYLTDAGTYKCVADNEVGKPKEHTMKLTVVAAPHVEKMPPPITGAAPGTDVTIPCQSTGVPAPKLTWTYNAQPLKASEHIVINHSVNGNLTIADLTIKGAKASDKGYYGCRAENEHGVLYRETALDIA